MQAIPDPRSIRAVRRQMTYILLAFSLASTVIGLIVLASIADPWLRAIGWQFAIWGLIDLVFAWLGVTQSRRADRGEVDDLADALKLQKALRISDKTNWVWVLIGLALVGLGIEGDRVIAAHGIGVLIQGGFLLVLDRVYLYRLEQFRLA